MTPVDADRFRGDMTIVRSPHGITAVGQKICVSNDVAVHVLEVDVLPGPAWAQVASESHDAPERDEREIEAMPRCACENVERRRY